MKLKRLMAAMTLSLLALRLPMRLPLLTLLSRATPRPLVCRATCPASAPIPWRT